MGYFELDDTGPPPVFVMSHDRSGSTLLRIVLDTHPELCCPGELMLARCMEALLYAVDNTLGVAVPELSGPDAAAARANEVRKILNGLMRAYARAHDKQVWCEKWPGSSRLIDDYERVFPDARYIVLYRDPLDTIDSCIRTYGRFGFSGALSPSVAARPRNLMQAMAYSWTEETRRLLALEKRVGDRAFRLRYEDMVRDPAAALPPLFRFLGLAWDPEIITKTFEVRHDHPGQHGDESVTTRRKFDASGLGAGAARVPLPQIGADALDVIDGLNAQLGYEAVRGRKVFTPLPKVRTVAQEAIDKLVAHVFEQRIPDSLRANAAQMEGRKGTVEFVITDGVPRRWWVTFDDGNVTVDNEEKPAGCAFSLDQSLFLEIAGGRTTIIESHRKGALGLRGDWKFLGLMGYFF